MLTSELIDLREELEFLLQQRGPVQFIRELALSSEGAQLRPHESRSADSHGGRSTRFVFRDSRGDEAFLTITVEAHGEEPPRLFLDCARRTNPVITSPSMRRFIQA